MGYPVIPASTAFTVGRRPIVCAKRLLFAQRSAAGGLRGRLAGRHPPGGPPEANPTLYTLPRNVHLFQRNWGGPWLVHRISFQKAHGEKDSPTIFGAFGAESAQFSIFFHIRRMCRRASTHRQFRTLIFLEYVCARVRTRALNAVCCLPSMLQKQEECLARVLHLGR